MVYTHPRPCHCGSGLLDRELVDAAGIFCCYVCDKCIAEKKKGYRPSIFEVGTPYAATGDEADIDRDWYECAECGATDHPTSECPHGGHG